MTQNELDWERIRSNWDRCLDAVMRVLGLVPDPLVGAVYAFVIGACVIGIVRTLPAWPGKLLLAIGLLIAVIGIVRHDIELKGVFVALLVGGLFGLLWRSFSKR